MSHATIPTLLLGALLLAAPAAAGEPAALPAPPILSHEAPLPRDLLDPAPLPEDTADPDEPPILGRPDALIYRYGERIPRITCLPYRVCTLLLHPEETVLSLALGDSERWQVQEVSAPGTRPAVLLKAQGANLLTNLVVKTDRRLYVIELLSPTPGATDPRSADAAYDALVMFSYPEAWATDVAEPAAAPALSSREPPRPAAGPSDLHFDYRFDRPFWPRHRLGWTPDVVYDDGERTYIRLPPEARRHDLPAVLDVTAGATPPAVSPSCALPEPREP